MRPRAALLDDKPEEELAPRLALQVIVSLRMLRASVVHGGGGLIRAAGEVARGRGNSHALGGPAASHPALSCLHDTL